MNETGGLFTGPPVPRCGPAPAVSRLLRVNPHEAGAVHEVAVAGNNAPAAEVGGVGNVGVGRDKQMAGGQVFHEPALPLVEQINTLGVIGLTLHRVEEILLLLAVELHKVQRLADAEAGEQGGVNIVDGAPAGVADVIDMALGDVGGEGSGIHGLQHEADTGLGHIGLEDGHNTVHVGQRALVGDGNHSLASAKMHWENIKSKLSDEKRENHSARYALVEIENIFDDSLHFEPIHRLILGAKGDFLIKLKQEIKGDYISKAYEGSECLEISMNPNAILALKDIQNFIDK